MRISAMGAWTNKILGYSNTTKDQKVLSAKDDYTHMQVHTTTKRPAESLNWRGILSRRIGDSNSPMILLVQSRPIPS